MIFIVKFALKIRGNLNQQHGKQYIFEKEIGKTIPRVIHQIYIRDNKALPIEIQNNIAHLKAMNPGWEYKLYDDTDIISYIDAHYPKLLPIYKLINPIYGAAKADFFRYLLIYNEGGVYLDIKSSVEKPLDVIIREDDKYLLSQWQNGIGDVDENKGINQVLFEIPLGEYQQFHIIATSGHPFLKAVINSVCNNIIKYNPFLHDTGDWAVFSVTGPFAYTLAIHPLLKIHPHRLERNEKCYGLIVNIMLSHNKNYHSLYGKHYSTCIEPLTLKSPIQNYFYPLLRPALSYPRELLSKLKHNKL